MAGTVEILPQTIENPLTTIGKYAGTCYGTNTQDPDKNRNRGLNCVKSGHGRVLEFCDVHLKLSDWSIRTYREFMRHVGDGLTALQSSTRYINESNFDYFTPGKINKNEKALDIYKSTMNDIQQAYQNLIAAGVTKEDAANVLPLGLTGTLIIKKNARCLSDMSHVRLCARAYHEYRELMQEIVKQLKDYSEEWNQLCELIFMPKCELYGYCEEEYSCGKFPKKF